MPGDSDRDVAQASAWVLVSFVVDERGRVIDSWVVPDRRHPPADPTFVTAALAAVDRWQFTPGRNNGVPVKVEWRVPIEFQPAAR